MHGWKIQIPSYPAALLAHLDEMMQNQCLNEAQDPEEAKEREAEGLAMLIGSFCPDVGYEGGMRFTIEERVITRKGPRGIYTRYIWLEPKDGRLAWRRANGSLYGKTEDYKGEEWTGDLDRDAMAYWKLLSKLALTPGWQPE